MKKNLSILSLLIVLMGCSKLKYGNVIEKDYHPEHEDMILMPLIMSDGKTTTTTYIPMFFHYNESWSIDVKGVSTKDKTITKTFYVSQHYFDSIQEGNFICVIGMCDNDSSKHKIQ